MGVVFEKGKPERGRYVDDGAAAALDVHHILLIFSLFFLSIAIAIVLTLVLTLLHLSQEVQKWRHPNPYTSFPYTKHLTRFLSNVLDDS